MHPVRFFREMTRVPTWRLEGETLVLPSPAQTFIMHRRELNDTCALNFTRTMRLNQAIPGMIVSPDGLHVAPNIKVDLVSRVTPYESTIRFNTIDEIRVRDTSMPIEEQMHSRQFGKEVLIPRTRKTYDLYGLGGYRSKPRCARLPMRVDSKITQDNPNFDDRPFIGFVAPDGHSTHEDAFETTKEIFLAQRTNLSSKPVVASPPRSSDIHIPAGRSGVGGAPSGSGDGGAPSGGGNGGGPSGIFAQNVPDAAMSGAPNAMSRGADRLVTTGKASSPASIQPQSTTESFTDSAAKEGYAPTAQLMDLEQVVSSSTELANEARNLVLSGAFQ